MKIVPTNFTKVHFGLYDVHLCEYMQLILLSRLEPIRINPLKHHYTSFENVINTFQVSRDQNQNVQTNENGDKMWGKLKMYIKLFVESKRPATRRPPFSHKRRNLHRRTLLIPANTLQYRPKPPNAPGIDFNPICITPHVEKSKELQYLPRACRVSHDRDCRHHCRNAATPR